MRQKIWHLRLIVILLELITFNIGIQAQSIVTPNWILDSLIFETKLGRQCSQVMNSQALEIEALGKELVATGTALKLSESKSSTLESLLQNQKQSQELLTQQYALDRKKFKSKIRKLWTFVVGEGVCIVLIVVLL